MGAEPRFTYEDLKEKVKKYKDSEKALTLENGREYRLDKGIVVEVLGVDQLSIKNNFFDFENGIVIHDTGNNDISSECLEMITPFKDLRSERIKEVTEIGCLLYDRQNRLTSRNDDLDAFNKKFCQIK